MRRLIVKIKNSKFLNTGFLKKIKDKIYYKFISPNEEKKTDKYRKEILEKFGKICKNTTWFLSSGSFLRHYRDNTMDGQDLDFDIIDKDFEKVKDNFFKNGFRVKQFFVNKKGKITEYKFLYNDVEIDVFLISKKGKKFHQYFTFEKNNAKKIQKKVDGNKIIVTGKDYISYERIISNADKITTYDYDGVKYNGPKNAEEHIVELYGYGWKEYDPNYDPKTSPENNKPIPHDNAKSVVYIEPVDFYEDV